MTKVTIPYAYNASGTAAGKRKPLPVRISDAVTLDIHDMQDDAIVVARLPPPQSFGSAESQDGCPPSYLVLYDGSFWTEIVRADGYLSDGSTLGIEDLETERMQEVLTRNDPGDRFIVSRDPSYGRDPIFGSTQEAGFVKDIRTEQAPALSQINRNLEELAIFGGRVMRRALEPVLVLNWGEVYRKDGRHNVRIDFADPDSLAVDDNWAQVVHRPWSGRDPSDPLNPFASGSMIATNGYTRTQLLHLDVYALSDLHRMAEFTNRRREAKLPPGWHDPANFEVLRPDLLRFDRDAFLYGKAVAGLAASVGRTTVHSVRICNRLNELVEEIGDRMDRIYSHVGEIDRLFADVVEQNLGSEVFRNQIAQVRSSDAFEEKLATFRDHAVLTGTVSFRHVQTETIYAISPETEGVDLPSPEDMAAIVDEIEGVVGTFVAENGTFMVRVSSMYEEDSVMALVSSALTSHVAALGPNPKPFAFAP